jgi:hypothetical protein
MANVIICKSCYKTELIDLTVRLQQKKAPETGGKERIHFTLKGAGNISNKTTIGGGTTRHYS